MQQLKKWFASYLICLSYLQLCLHTLKGESATGCCRCRGVSAGFQHLVFRYDKNYSKGNIDQLCSDIFMDQHIRQFFKVQCCLLLLVSSGCWCPVTLKHTGIAQSADVLIQVKAPAGDWVTVDPPTRVTASAVACSATRLDMFDKLAHASDPPILQGNSWMVQRTADGADMHGFVVHDNLREMLLCEDSANHSLLSEFEQQEFLWKVFRHLVLGGQLNQYEDDVDQYRQAAKALYRTLIRCVHALSLIHI